MARLDVRSGEASPRTRGVGDIGERAERLARYEKWEEPTRVDFEAIAGAELWRRHWENHRAILDSMREAEKTAGLIRARIASRADPLQPPALAGEGEATAAADTV